MIHTMNNKKIAITLGTVCLALTMAIVVQINTIDKTSKTVALGFSKNDLRDEVLKWKEKFDRSTEELDNAEKQLAKIRTDSAKNDTSTSSKEEQIRNNNIILGLTDVEGKGVEIIVKDDPNASAQTIGVLDDLSYHIVHDGDLRRIVNELKNAGAEAISINGQRIVTSSTITCIGNVIKINDEKVSSPFIIKAIGFPERMESALTRAGGYLDWLQEFGISITTKKSDNVKIDKYSGAITSKYMK